jgi:hypothetical protein
MIIELFDTHVMLSEKAKDYNVCKVVSLDDLLAVMGKHASTGFGLLPDNLRYIEAKEEKIVICLQFGKQKRDIRFAKNSQVNTFKGVACPAGVLLVKLQRQNNNTFLMVGSWIYAIRGDRIISDNDFLYKMPLPNIFEDNKICWGSVTFAPFNGLSAVESVVSQFWSATMNSDLFSERLLTEPKRFYRQNQDLVSSMLETLSQSERFDDSLLVQTQKRIKNTILATLGE